MKNSNYKEKLFDIIVSGKGLQYVMDACSDLIGNPFVFSNQSLQPICRSASCEQFPEVFDWLENQHGERFQYAQEAARAGYFRAIYAGDEPVRGMISGNSANWIAARVRFKKQIIGNILVADCLCPFTDEYENLLPLVCQTIAFAVRQSGERHGLLNYAPLLMGLLEGRTEDNIDEDSIRTNFKLLHHILPGTMRILVMRSANEEYLTDLGFLDAQLFSQFPSSVGIIYKGDCIRVIDGAVDLEIIEERLKKYVYSDYKVCGISRVFLSPLAMHDAYLQADAAIRLGKTGKERKIVCFDDVAGPYLLEQVTEAHNMSVEGIIVPAIFRLLALGEYEGIEKIQDLAAYLSCGRNVTQAAALRGIHKNSMYYRLNKILELTGIDLASDNTCIQLTTSLSLLGYLPFK